MVYPSQRRCWPPPAAGETLDEDGTTLSGKGHTAHAFSQVQVLPKVRCGGGRPPRRCPDVRHFHENNLKCGPGAISGAPTQVGTHLFLHERRRVRLARLDEMCPPAKEA